MIKGPFDINQRKKKFFEEKRNMYAYVSFLTFIFTQRRYFQTNVQLRKSMSEEC